MELLVTPTIDSSGPYMGVQLKFTYAGTADIAPSYYQKFEVQLLNQKSDCEHFSETQDVYLQSYGCCTSWYRSEHISIELLYKNTATCQYLKNDTVFFKVRAYIDYNSCKAS